MQTREEVKKGLITATDAARRIDPDCATGKWLARRIQRKVTAKVETKVEKEVIPNKKYRHKPKSK